MTRTAFLFLLLLAVIPGVGFAATPPALVNYEGVLRDQSGNPLTGSYDMVFRFMDAATLGNEILVDSHLGAGAVVVSGGLFNVALGSGAVMDGSGPGTYTALDAVFRDYSAVWLEVQVGTETLSPRTRLQSAPYALNASNLLGHPSNYFLDISNATQQKNGPLIIDTLGGRADLGTLNSGIEATGPLYGGVFFVPTPVVGSAGVYAQGEYGIDALGYTAGGRFKGPSPASATLAWDNTAGYFTGAGLPPNQKNVTLASLSWAVDANGPAHFQNALTGTSATLVSGAAAGDFSGASLGLRASNGTLNVSASLAAGDLGVDARGTNIGGYFDNLHGSYAEIPWYDIGMRAHGSYGGGYFENYTGAWGLVGYSSYKIFGNGAMSFVQNHPADPEKVIVYAAPEGDEVAVYTRGSGRLVDGLARVALGETFALVANPDIGITATVTPIDDMVLLTIVEKSTKELVVRGPAGSHAEFDYMVWGLRVGFEEQSIIQPKERDAKIPSMAGHEKIFAAEPALRSHTALARFTGIEEKVAGRSTFDFSRADTLRDAVGVFPYREPPVDPADVPGRPAIGPMSPPSEAFVPGSGAGAAATALPAEPGAPSSAEGESGAGESGGPAAAGEVATSHARTHSLDVFSAEGAIEVGDVVSLAVDSPGSVILSEGPDDTLVIGCAQVSQAGSGWAGTSKVDQATLLTGQVAVATSRIAVCRVDASYGPISVGDRLSPSPTAGMAMKLDPGLAGATILGRAIDPLDSGSALVRVLLGAR